MDRTLLASRTLIIGALMTFGACKQGTIEVHSLSLRGVRAVDQTRLKGVLATREGTRIPITGWRLPWSKKSYFDRGQFDADLQRIQAFYADRGYPDARVTGADVKLNDKQSAVDVTLTIREGDPITVAAVDFRGFDVVPPSHLESVKRRMPLKVDQPRDRQAVIATHELAINELRDEGYPYAEVDTQEEESPDRRRTSLVFVATPGTLARFGQVAIVGNTSVGEDVVRRQLTFKPGELYRRGMVQDSQRRLYAMDLFQFATVETSSADRQAPDVPIRVTVSEGKHQRSSFSVGYGTEEKARIDAQYRHVNFLGGGRSAGVRARYSSLDRGVRLDLHQPYLFTPHFSGDLQGQRWYTYAPAYRSIVTGGKAIVTHRSSVQTSWSMSVTNERTTSLVNPTVLNDPKVYGALISLGLNPTTSRQEGTIMAAGLDFQRSTADSVLNPTRGYQVDVHLEKAAPVASGTFNYFSFEVDGRHYLPITRRVGIANRVQVGAINAVGNDPTQVPFSKKYFLGGATSLRGWGRYDISPLSASGVPVGGNSFIAGSSELRLRLRDKLGAVLFVDAGNVWAGDWGVDVHDLRYDVGPGLRYQTPVGPLRIDFGYQLNPAPIVPGASALSTRRWRLHFSIGQAF